MKLNISLEQSTKRRNIVIDDEFDEDQLTARRNEYYSTKEIKCTKCNIVKSYSLYFKCRENANGIQGHCKDCEMLYIESLNKKVD